MGRQSWGWMRSCGGRWGCMSSSLTPWPVTSASSRWPIRGQYSGHVTCLGQSEASIQIRLSVLTNQRPVFMSRDMSRPIRSQFSGQVICLVPLAQKWYRCERVLWKVLFDSYCQQDMTFSFLGSLPSHVSLFFEFAHNILMKRTTRQNILG